MDVAVTNVRGVGLPAILPRLILGRLQLPIRHSLTQGSRDMLTRAIAVMHQVTLLLILYLLFFLLHATSLIITSERCGRLSNGLRLGGRVADFG